MVGKQLLFFFGFSQKLLNFLLSADFKFGSLRTVLMKELGGGSQGQAIKLKRRAAG